MANISSNELIASVPNRFVAQLQGLLLDERFPKEAFSEEGGGLSEICDSNDVNAFIRQCHLHDIHQDKSSRMYYNPNLYRDAPPEILALIRRSSKTSFRPKRPGGNGPRRRRHRRLTPYDDEEEDFDDHEAELYGRHSPDVISAPQSSRRKVFSCSDYGKASGGADLTAEVGALRSSVSILQQQLAAAHEAIQVLSQVTHRQSAFSGNVLVQVPTKNAAEAPSTGLIGLPRGSEVDVRRRLAPPVSAHEVRLSEAAFMAALAVPAFAAAAADVPETPPITISAAAVAAAPAPPAPAPPAPAAPAPPVLVAEKALPHTIDEVEVLPRGQRWAAAAAEAHGFIKPSALPLVLSDYVADHNARLQTDSLGLGLGLPLMTSHSLGGGAYGESGSGFMLPEPIIHQSKRV